MRIAKNNYTVGFVLNCNRHLTFVELSFQVKVLLASWEYNT